MSEVRNILCNIVVNVISSHAMLAKHFNVRPIDSMWVRTAISSIHADPRTIHSDLALQSLSQQSLFNKFEDGGLPPLGACLVLTEKDLRWDSTVCQ